MKRLLRISVIFLLLLGLITSIVGCNEKGNTENMKNGVISNIDVKQKKTATITFYMLVPPQNSEKVTDEISRRLNINLKFKQLDRRLSLEEKVKLLKTTEWDAILFNGAFAYFDDQGCIMDLSTYWPENAPVLYNKFTKEELGQTSNHGDGRLLTVPPHIRSSNRNCVIVRRDVMTKLGIGEITNFDDLEAFLKQVKVNYPSIIPLSATSMSTEMFIEPNGYVHYGNDLVYKWDDPELKLIPWEQTEAFNTAVTTIKRWQDTGYLGYVNASTDAISSGKVAAIISQFDSQLAASLPSDEALSIFPLNLDMTASKTDITNRCSISINKKSKNPERVMEFIEWVHADQKNYDLLMYGIEGDDYTLKDGRIMITGGEKAYNGFEVFTAFEDIDYMRTPDSLNFDYKDLYEKVSELNTRYPPHMQIIPEITSGIDVEFMRTVQDMRTQEFFEMRSNIYNGQFNLNVNEFISRNKEAGVDKYVSVIQQQLAAEKKMK